MDFLKALAITADIVFISVLLYFVVPLRWEYEEDRASIVGFSFMIFAIVLNAVLVFLARY